MEEENLTLSELLKILKKRIKLIIVITILTTVVTAIVCFNFVVPKYEASTKLFIGKEQSQSSEIYNYSDVELFQKLIKTYSDVIMTKDMIDTALESKGIEESSYNILENLSVAPKTDTQLIRIIYRSSDKEKTAAILEAVTEEFVRYSKELIPNSNVKIVEKVTLPNEPVTPNKPLYISLAFIIGILIGIVLSILLQLIDNTFKDRKQVEEKLGIPVLGNIPCIN